MVPVAYEDQHEQFASRAINSSAQDLARWVSMLLRGGTVNDTSLMPQAYLEAAFSEHAIIRGSFGFARKYDLLADTYGYGWFVHQYKNLYRINHEGNVSGFTASVTLYPHRDLGIVVLTRQGAANLLTKAITGMVASRLLALEQTPWDEYDIRIGEATLPLTDFPPLNAEQPPTHALTDYCGTYLAEGYGAATVLIEAGRLMIDFPAFKMYLAHHGYNTFINRVVAEHHQNAPSFYIDFFPNREGTIVTMAIGFAEEPVRFTRME